MGNRSDASYALDDRYAVLNRTELKDVLKTAIHLALDFRALNRVARNIGLDLDSHVALYSVYRI